MSLRDYGFTWHEIITVWVMTVVSLLICVVGIVLELL